MRYKSKNIKEILIIGLSSLGDNLLLTPALRAVREYFPQARISMAVGPRAQGLFRNHPWFCQELVYDKAISLKEKITFIKHWRGQFDLTVDFRNSLLGFLIGKNTIGFLWKEPFSKKGKVHEARRRLEMLGKFITLPEDESIYFHIDDRDRISMKRLLEEVGILLGEKFALINPGATWDKKRWPKEGFAQVIDTLYQELGIKSIMVASSKEEELAKQVADLCKSGPKNLAGKTTLRELGALLERASLFITNDTGTLHIASAFKVPTVAIYGPGNWIKYGPYLSPHRVVNSGLDCSPCEIIRCPKNFLCMELISADKILQAAKSLWQEKTKEKIIPKREEPH